MDFNGVELQSVYHGIVSSLMGDLPANVNHLQAGTYYIKLEAIAENEIHIFLFIKQ